MLPRLQAEEQLAAIAAHGLGSGVLPPGDAQPMLDRLEQQAQGVAGRAKKADRSVLAAMGIGVVLEPPEKGVSDG